MKSVEICVKFVDFNEMKNEIITQTIFTKILPKNGT